jgi:hypothetical protein
VKGIIMTTRRQIVGAAAATIAAAAASGVIFIGLAEGHAGAAIIRIFQLL